MTPFTVSLAAAVPPLSAPVWPLAAYALGVFALVAGQVALSWVLGPKHRDRPAATHEPYESGVVSAGSARLRFPVRFYLITLFFVIFDLEAVFVFAWAVAVRELGWRGYFSICFFIGLLLVALVYLVRTGALDWSGRQRSLDARAGESPAPERGVRP